MSEWRQLRLLIRLSLGRLMDTAVASREIDAEQFAIWSFALVATPPFFFAARMLSKYEFMWRRPDVLERVVLADRLFFVIYVMLAAALLAAVLWDALFPDRQDQEIVGVLPVRPRTLAAARLITAIGVATIFAGGIALLSGVMYLLPVAAASRSYGIVGWPPAVLIAHVSSLTMAGLFTFISLLALRGLAVASVGAEAAQRGAAALQFVTIVLLLEVFIFLPGVLEGLIGELNVAAAARSWPPLWFLGFYGWIGGPPAAHVPGLVWLALGATGGALLVATIVYLGPAAWNTRRTIEALMKDRAGRAVAIAQRLASPALRQPVSRAVFGFTLASLARSRRHTLAVATYLGIAVAMAGVRLMVAAVRDKPIALDAPSDYLLSIPLVLTFFLVIGLRAAFAVPTDVEANWTFRLAQPRSTAPCVHAVGVVLLLLAVLPVTGAWLLVAASLWDARSALGGAIMHAATGAALVELVLITCRAVPFTRGHVPATGTVRGHWILGLLALHVFAFRLDDVQLAALESAVGVALYVAAMLLIVAAARVYRRSRRATWTLAFDAPVERAWEPLNLSQAAG